MNRRQIPIDAFCLPSFRVFESRWLALTVGAFTPGTFNAMTVAWGSLGFMWGKPYAQVVVRPSRHTYQMIEEYETFTLSVFPESYRDTLSYLGSVSGRDEDKISKCGLTPIPVQNIDAPGYAEAELVFACKKMYYEDVNPDHFLDPAIKAHYPDGDYHRSYYGEILSIEGIDAYCLDLEAMMNEIG